MRIIVHFKVAAVLGLALAFAGCSFLQSIEPDTKQLAVQYATLKVIDGDSDRAARVVDLVQEGRQYVESGASVTVAALYEGVRDRIDWQSLDPADRILIEAILTRARERLREEIGVGLLDPDQQVKVLTVLDWIEAAASGHQSTQ